MRTFGGIIQAGRDCVYLNASNAVCGLLKPLDDKYVHPPPKEAYKPNAEARMSLLREKHVSMHQKRSQRRREVKGNAST